MSTTTDTGQNHSIEADQLPLINAHTHIFVGGHVPPLLAKKAVFWPFYHLFHLGAILWLFRKYLEIRRNAVYKPNSLLNRYKKLRRSISHIFILNFVTNSLLLWLIINALVAFSGWFGAALPAKDKTAPILEQLVLAMAHWVQDVVVLDAIGTRRWVEILLVALAFVFVRVFRRLLLLFLKQTGRVAKFIPSQHSIDLVTRYISMGRFANRITQRSVLNDLCDQYPPHTKFVALTMDMEYMDAGKVKPDYSFHKQLDEIDKLKQHQDYKETLHPFIFVDPRRIVAEQHLAQPYFDWELIEQDFVVKDCVVKQYLEEKSFAGIKLYPALGYYPFDASLLPVYLYALEHNIPIMTHCISGTIFYRGNKKAIWNHHPVFKETAGKGKKRPLGQWQKKNSEFTLHFTHPLNYLVLLHEPLLRHYIGGLAGEQGAKIKALFGFANNQTRLKRDLAGLKICLAHFGGEVEWTKYLESDRYDNAQALIKDREQGLNMLPNEDLDQCWGKLEQVYKYVDWYTIICSLCLQYPNMYTDVSYILSKPRIYPLLRETLDAKTNAKLRRKVLFGTDYYVVRNHFSDKDLLPQIQFGLPNDDFDVIARENPRAYLCTTLPHAATW